MQTTPEQRGELRRLEAAATGTPWYRGRAADREEQFIWGDGPYRNRVMCGDCDDTDRMFIIALRNAAPALLADAERCARMERVMERIAKYETCFDSLGLQAVRKIALAALDAKEPS